MTKLQAHVKHLEAMIAALPPAKERFPMPKSRQPSPRAQVAVPPAQQPSSECYDLTAQDLAGALLSLITSGSVVPARAGQDSFLPDGQSSRGLLAECVALVATSSRQSGRDPFIHAAAATTPPMSTPTPDGLLALVPPERELRVAYDFYRAHIAPFCFSVNHDEIEARWPRMKAILDAHDSELFVEEFEPQFFAVVMATSAFGLLKLPDALAQQHGIVGDRQAEAARWVRSATVFLEFVGPDHQRPSFLRADRESRRTADRCPHPRRNPGGDCPGHRSHGAYPLTHSLDVEQWLMSHRHIDWIRRDSPFEEYTHVLLRRVRRYGTRFESRSSRGNSPRVRRAPTDLLGFIQRFDQRDVDDGKVMADL